MSIVPTFKDLSFYTSPEANTKRYANLEQQFQTKYGKKSEFIARSPGRVNIMGDHIDYCYFSVLPMALDADMIVAVGESESEGITLANTSPNYKSETVTLPSDGSVVTIDKEVHSWVNYFKCGLLVAHRFIIENHPELVDGGKKPLKNLNMLFDGTVPTGGGLSSSAAFCVASTLAVLRANGLKKITKEDLTRITVVSEHYVGVNTGGMDQCASIYGDKNKALLIQFKPKLIGIPFELPVIKPYDIVFLVTNSLLESNKVETAPTNYNLRAVEAATCAEYMAAKFNLKLTADSNLKTGTLRGFMDDYFEKIKGEARWDGSDVAVGVKRLTELVELIELPEIFNEEEKYGFTTEQIAKALGLSVEEYTAKFLSSFPVRYELLKIYQRTKHIFGDSLRVLQCLELIQNALKHPDSDNVDYIRNFGRLMNESQASCNVLNHASLPKLEELCAVALEYGSYGSRVTGAGFGGSVVHVTTTDRIPRLLKGLKNEWYRKTFPNITDEELESAIVVSKPATGSCIVEMN